MIGPSAILAALALTAAPPAAAPAPAPAPAASSAKPIEETLVEGVVVTAREEELVRAFVAQLSEPPLGQTQLGRWHRKICPGVIGLEERYARFLNDRLAMAAYGVGLDVGEPGCRGDIMIAFTSDGGRFAQAMVRHHPRWMDKWGDEGSRGRRALKDFVETPRPVRWWHITNTVEAEAATGAVNRVSKQVRQDFHRMLIVVDLEKTGPVPFGALADYVAMVALAQLEPSADTREFPTILNLFAGAAAPERLTDWDRRYLSGVYEMRRDASSVRKQNRDIARAMLKRPSK